MTTDAFKYKRPFSPDEETDAALQQWQTPDLTNERQRDNGRTNALNKTQPVAKAKHAPVDEELVVKPLTADDIEQMRQTIPAGFAIADTMLQQEGTEATAYIIRPANEAKGA